MVESVYSAVRTDSLYKADCVSSLKGYKIDSKYVNKETSEEDDALRQVSIEPTVRLSYTLT